MRQKPQLWWICSCLIQVGDSKLKQRPLMQELTDALISKKKTEPPNSDRYDYRPD